MDARIEKAIAEIAETRDIALSVVKGLAAQGEQLVELKTKVGDLQAKLDASSPVTAEDLTALGTAVADLDATNEQLKTAIPAGTPFEPSNN